MSEYRVVRENRTTKLSTSARNLKLYFQLCILYRKNYWQYVLIYRNNSFISYCPKIWDIMSEYQSVRKNRTVEIADRIQGADTPRSRHIFLARLSGISECLGTVDTLLFSIFTKIVCLAPSLSNLHPWALRWAISTRLFTVHMPRTLSPSGLR